MKVSFLGSQESLSKRNIRHDLRPLSCLDIKFSSGGMGDSIARLPAIKYILENYPHVQKIRLFAQDYFRPVVEHFFPIERVEFVGISKLKEELKARPSKAAMHTDPLQHTTMRAHLTHHAFAVLVDEVPMSALAYSYLQFNNAILPYTIQIPGKYAVIAPGFTSGTREWKASEINKVCQWLLLKDITPVFLGKSESVYHEDKEPTKAEKPQGVDYSLGVDLWDSTSILESAAILSKACTVIGVDNGLIHLAAMTSESLPIVCGYTSVSPFHRMPIRRGMLGWNVRAVTSKVGCSPCQTKANFLYDFDFRRCYYGDYACLNDMSAKAFIKELEMLNL